MGSTFYFALFALAALTVAMLAVCIADMRFTPAVARAALAAALAAGWGMT